MQSPRLPTPLLAGLVVVGLVLGWVWWTATAPPAAAPAATGPATVGYADPPVPLRQPAPSLPAAEPQQPLLALLGDGDPAGLSVALDPDDVDWLLSPSEDPLLRQGVVLGPDATYLLQGPATPGEHRFEVSCVGRGEIEVELTVHEGTPQRLVVACDHVLASVDLTLQPGYAAVRISSRAPEDAVAIVAFQLLRR